MADLTIEIIKYAFGFVLLVCPVCHVLAKFWIFPRGDWEDQQCDNCKVYQSYKVK